MVGRPDGVADAVGNADADFQAVLDYVETEMGFSTAHYTDSYLDRRITARQRHTGDGGYEAYLARLEAAPEERAALLDALSVNVTGFFRNPELWDRLRDVLRELSAEQDRLRLWSAACADGREAYSLAMLALDDDETDADRVEVFATDVDGAALDAARDGVYASTATTDVEAELAPVSASSVYVRREGNHFRIRDRVRELVSFGRHDLIRDDALGPFDLVLCRNLFTYLDAAYKAPVVETVDASMAPQGYLALGMTESLPPSYRSSFESVDQGVRLYRSSTSGE